MCGALIEEANLSKLVSLKVRDSKLTTKSERENLFKKIKKVLKSYKIIIIEPKEIDKAVNSDVTNLNWLEADKTIEIINNLKPDKAIIDCPSNNIENYKKYLSKKIDKSIELQLEHNAERFPIVAAASILAKVTRDREIEKIQKKLKEPIGSGYPSDPITIDFVKNNYNKYPEILRKSWDTYKKIKEGKIQKTIFDFHNYLENPKLKELIKLTNYGYEFIEPKSEYEIARMKGQCTVILYKTGKILVQGKGKEKVEKILK